MPERTCSVAGCDKPQKSSDLCGMHYYRLRTRGEVGEAEPERRPRGSEPPQCAIAGCGKPSRRRGWCNAHYERWRRTGDVGSAEVQPYRLYLLGCNMDFCSQPQASGIGLCWAHYGRWRKWGDPYYEEIPRGADHVGWVGDAVGYSGAHDRVRVAYGPARNHNCVGCGGSATDWAYDHADRDEVLSPEGWPYSLSIDHYQPMCRTCHVRLDARGESVEEYRRA